MTYVGLGWRTVKGAADTTGRNPGNWTVTFDPNTINVTVPNFELYKLIVTGSAATATFTVYVDIGQWDTAVYATNNSWDPTQVLLLNPGNTVYFFYTTASSDGHQPIVTAWFRHDPALTQIYGVTS